MTESTSPRLRQQLESPTLITAAPYEQFDEKTDGDLVKALQETVWEVVTDQRE
jgi:hypothetical protein